MLVSLASPRGRWCLSEYVLVSYTMRFCIKPVNIRQETCTIWEKLIKLTLQDPSFDEFFLLSKYRYAFTISIRYMYFTYPVLASTSQLVAGLIL